MPIAKVQLQDGRIAKFEVPDGTTEAQVMEYAQSHLSGGDQYRWQGDEFKPTDGMSGGQKFLAGAGKAFSDLGHGVQQLFTLDDAKDAALQQEAGETRQRDADLMGSGAGLAGNLTGNFAAALPATFVPGAATIPGGALVGAGFGAMAPSESDEHARQNMLFGAGGGALGTAGAKMLGRVLSPQTSKEATTLLKNKVPLTPGQILGGKIDDFEQAMQSVPVLGDVVSSARQSGIKAFNKAAIDKVLEPIGKTTKEVGEAGLESAHKAIKQSYDDVVPKIHVVADDQFMAEMDTVSDMLQYVPDESAKIIRNVMDKKVLNRFVGDGRMSGESFKRIDSELGALIRKNSGNTASAGEREIADAAREMQAIMFRAASRATPESADLLRNVDRAYGRLLRVERAAVGPRAQANGGVFSPADLNRAVKQMGGSNRTYLHSDDPLRQLSSAAHRTMSQTVPDSGTPRRMMMSGAALGGLAAIEPTTMAAVLGAGGAYFRPGLALSRALLSSRPDLARRLGAELPRLAPGMAGAGASLTTQ